MQLQDGFTTLVTFANDPTIQFWEKSLTPPGLDGGPAVDTKTMRNLIWATKSPQVLVELTEVKFKAAYDPVIYVAALAMVNVNQLITITFPDNDTYSFMGYLQSVKPDEIQMGTQPTAEVTIVPTMVDFTTLDAMGAPVIVGPTHTALIP